MNPYDCIGGVSLILAILICLPWMLNEFGREQTIIADCFVIGIFLIGIYTVERGKRKIFGKNHEIEG
ncbi:MAG TPA: hypothetical protein VMY59_08820 [Candidatus Thermoplasmatota archaeon]|nr:hypothetical protein [Candidatus Thermoplasmatota archaeon]